MRGHRDEVQARYCDDTCGVKDNCIAAAAVSGPVHTRYMSSTSAVIIYGPPVLLQSSPHHLTQEDRTAMFASQRTNIQAPCSYYSSGTRLYIRRCVHLYNDLSSRMLRPVIVTTGFPFRLQPMQFSTRRL